MNIFKNHCFTFLLLTLTSPKAYAEKLADYSIKNYLLINLVTFIRNEYFWSVGIILAITFVLDYDYYIQNKLKVTFSRFTIFAAVLGIFICTVIKLFY